jgi:hypothetical protein
MGTRRNADNSDHTQELMLMWRALLGQISE